MNREHSPTEIKIASLEHEFATLSGQISNLIQTGRLPYFIIVSRDERDRNKTLFFDERGNLDHYTPKPSIEDILYRYADLADDGYRAIQSAEQTESNEAFAQLDPDIWQEVIRLHRKKRIDKLALSEDEENYLRIHDTEPQMERNSRYSEQKRQYITDPMKKAQLLEDLVKRMKSAFQ